MSASLAREPINHRKSVLLLPLFWEGVVIACFGALIYWISHEFSILERAYELTGLNQPANLGGALAVFLLFFAYFFVLALVAVHKWRQAAEANQRLLEANQELEQTAREINKLRGLIPICAKCNRMKDDQGYWRRVEDYLSARAEVEFTHGLCPACVALLYPQLDMVKLAQEKRLAKKDGSGGGD
jgi:hypothetical protein